VNALHPEDVCEVAPSTFAAYGFADLQRGWAGTLISDQLLFQTVNGGATWTSMDLAPPLSTAVDVYFNTETEGFVVGSVGGFPSTSRADS
jgi:hypothetical protein